jgi:hypothetical protein
MRAIRGVSLVAAAGAAAAALVSAVPAGAAVHRPSAAPVAALKAAQAEINVGSTEEFSYAGAHLPAGAGAYLQRQSGSWKTIVKLGVHTSGTAGVKVTAIGSEAFRVVYTKESKVLAVSKTAGVKVRPAITIGLKGITTKVSTGQAPTFKYTALNLASGLSVELQEAFGAGGVWKKVVALPSTKLATVTAPKLGTLGQYPYRVAVVRAGKSVKSTAAVPVYAYGNVALTPFGAGSGTVQVGAKIFAYTDAADTSVYPYYNTHEAFTKTSCRSLSVRFAGDSDSQLNEATSYLEFVQQASDPVYASTTSGNVGTVAVTLDGGPLYIDMSSQSNADIIYDIVLNITGSCYTQSGSR